VRTRHPLALPLLITRSRYKFARRANAADGSMKDIAHIWEIAGGVASLDLLKVQPPRTYSCC
jgi:hypothetical protein